MSYGYNERSWAIDVIGEIKQYFSDKSLIIKNAGGENTLRSSGNVYFPDVLLFADHDGNCILHGWELKMPDTPIADPELIDNAKKKANVLGVNSFLVWNVTEAALYRINNDNKHEKIKEWKELYEITDRYLVREKSVEWKSALYKILEDLVDFFNRGEIRSTSIINSLTGDGLTEFILENSSLVAEGLKERARCDVSFDDEVDVWWDTFSFEYSFSRDAWKPLADHVLISWINKFTFAHLLKNVREEAAIINSIDHETTLVQARTIFEKITDSCNFWNVFSPQLGEYDIHELVWIKLKSYHALLLDLKIGSINHEMMQQILQSTIYRAQRKIAGQFTTPPILAQLLVELSVKNKRDSVYDPCCGTGTIPKALFEQKVDADISSREALKSVWASDKFSYPLQLATIALSDPKNFGEVLNIFQSDMSDAKRGMEANLRDPKNGSEIVKVLPDMGTIVCNLPFIRQETALRANGRVPDRANAIIKSHTKGKIKLDAKSDFYAHMPFVLWDLLKVGGNMGIIVSNAWLATNWGVAFKEALQAFFHFKYIVISGKGKWFANADVVTNIIVLEKKVETEDSSDRITHFVTINEEIQDLVADGKTVKDLARNIRTGRNLAPHVTYNYEQKDISFIHDLGLSWGVFFSDCRWMRKVDKKMIFGSNLLHIARGERRGANKLFYPGGSHGIEQEYLAPVLMSSKDIHDYERITVSEAFCCNVSLEELDENGHRGALSWIKQFENATNGTGIPLVESLERAGYHWYGMEPNTRGDFALSLNPDERLFVAKPVTRVFMDQRLIRLTSIDSEVDLELMHALMNSIIGLFYIEALGFGRGQGVLDLNASKFKRNYKILNPDILNEAQIEEIKTKFMALKKRGLLKLEDDLNSDERIQFDQAVLGAYGLEDIRKEIDKSLRTIFRIRKAVQTPN